MTPLAAGLDYFDLRFMGQRGCIATGLVHGAGGVALIDPGPSTSLPVLRAALACHNGMATFAEAGVAGKSH